MTHFGVFSMENLSILKDFQSEFICRFELNGRSFDKEAKVDGDQIKCTSMNFSYTDSSPNSTAKFSVLWNEGKVARSLDNPQNVRGTYAEELIT